MSTTIIAWLGSVGSIAIIAGLGWRVLSVIQALNEVLQAQLTEDGGGSLVDKVSRIPELELLVKNNHKEGGRRLDALESSTSTLVQKVGKLGDTLEVLTKFERKE